MDSLTIIEIVSSLALIVLALSFFLLSYKIACSSLKRHLEYSNQHPKYLSLGETTDQALKKRHKNNNILYIVKEGIITGKSEDSPHSSFKQETLVESENMCLEENYITFMEDKMRYYMNAEKYQSARTLNHLKKLEEEWI